MTLPEPPVIIITALFFSAMGVGLGHLIETTWTDWNGQYVEAVE